MTTSIPTQHDIHVMARQILTQQMEEGPQDETVSSGLILPTLGDHGFPHAYEGALEDVVDVLWGRYLNGEISNPAAAADDLCRETADADVTPRSTSRLERAFRTLPRFRRIEVLVEIEVLRRRAVDRLTPAAEDAAIDRVMTSGDGRAALEHAVALHQPLKLSKGDVFEYDAAAPHVSSPEWRPVTIAWVDEAHVHYRCGNETEIRQTPIDRFLEIVRPYAGRDHLQRPGG